MRRGARLTRVLSLGQPCHFAHEPPEVPVLIRNMTVIVVLTSKILKRLIIIQCSVYSCLRLDQVWFQMFYRYYAVKSSDGLYGVGVTMIPSLLMREQKPREIKECAESPTSISGTFASPTWMLDCRTQTFQHHPPPPPALPPLLRYT